MAIDLSGQPLWGDPNVFVDPGAGGGTGGGTGGGSGGGTGGGGTGGPFAFYRLNIFNGGGSPGGGAGFSTSFSELKFYDSGAVQIPTIGGSASASTAGFGAASNAFDGNINTLWGASVGASYTSPQWIQYHFTSAVTVASFSITARNDGFYVQAPEAFQLQGSNDGSTWTPLGNYSVPAPWTTAGQVQTLTVDSAHGTGAAIRLLITASATTVTSIAEWTFKDSVGGAVVPSGGWAFASDTFVASAAPSTGAESAFDGDLNTRWNSLNNPNTTSVWLAYQWSTALPQISSFCITSPAAGLFSQAPTALTIQTSPDGIAWTDQGSFTYTWSAAGQTSCNSVSIGGGGGGGTGTASIVIDPVQGLDGQGYDIVVTGTGTHFGSTTAVTISGDGATVSNVVVIDATDLTFHLFLDSTATIGERTVTTATGSEVPTAIFTVLPVIVTSGRKRGDIGWSQIREGLDGIWGFGPYGVATNGSFLADDIPKVASDGATLIGSGVASGALFGAISAAATHSESLTDGAGNLITANGDVVTVVGVPN